MSSTTVTAPVERMGIQLRGVYDGVSVWVEPDGTYTNRWAGQPGLERRAAAAQAWIDAQGAPVTVR